jgi:hypothetical protein
MTGTRKRMGGHVQMRAIPTVAAAQSAPAAPALRNKLNVPTATAAPAIRYNRRMASGFGRDQRRRR